MHEKVIEIINPEADIDWNLSILSQTWYQQVEATSSLLFDIKTHISESPINVRWNFTNNKAQSRVLIKKSESKIKTSTLSISGLCETPASSYDQSQYDHKTSEWFIKNFNPNSRMMGVYSSCLWGWLEYSCALLKILAFDFSCHNPWLVMQIDTRVVALSADRALKNEEIDAFRNVYDELGFYWSSDVVRTMHLQC